MGAWVYDMPLSCVLHSHRRVLYSQYKQSHRHDGAFKSGYLQLSAYQCDRSSFRMVLSRPSAGVVRAGSRVVSAA